MHIYCELFLNSCSHAAIQNVDLTNIMLNNKDVGFLCVRAVFKFTEYSRLTIKNHLKIE